METLLHDLRYAIRMLGKRRGFTAVAIITLALGIGANTATFNVVNAVLLRPLPFKEPDRLVSINHSYPKLGVTGFVSAPGFIDYRGQGDLFENSAVSTGWNINLTGQGEPERVQGRLVSAGFFPTLGFVAALGRVFLEEEDLPGKNHVVVLSHGLWQRRFGSDPAILDRQLTLNGENYTVIGVMPADFEFNSGDELWTPLGFTPELLAPNQRSNEYLWMIARLKPGGTLAQAQAGMDAVANQIREQYPNIYPPESQWGLALKPLQEDFIGDIRPLLTMLIFAVGFVLLIACANVANLLLARAAARRKEIATRTALGASRVRILRQLLTESVLLALLGGALGLALSAWGVKLLVAMNERIPRSKEIGIDFRVLGFTVGISLLTGIIFGLVPALHISKAGITETLKGAGRSSPITFGRKGSRSILVVAEVAIALVPLIGAGLMVKSFARVLEVNPGFRRENVLTLRLSLPVSSYRELPKVRAFYQQAIQQIESIPGVISAGGVTGLPMVASGLRGPFIIEGRPINPGEVSPNSDRRVTTSNYLKTMEIPLIRGRYFTDQDNAESPGVVIIDDAFARRYWPDEDPIGKRISFEGGPNNPRWREIVGVVGHVKNYGLDVESKQVLYYPHLQSSAREMGLAVRTEGDPKGMVAAVRNAIQSVDAQQPIFRLSTMDQLVADSTTQRRFTTLLLAVFAVVALLLTAVGLYGVMSYSITQRTQEIGVRMALGAQRGSVLRMVIGHGMTLALVGIVLGLALSLVLGLFLRRYMKDLLFDVSPIDPTMFVIISVVIGGAAMLASYIPARRATKVDPVIALRYEG
jgi:predicted permease